MIATPTSPSPWACMAAMRELRAVSASAATTSGTSAMKPAGTGEAGTMRASAGSTLGTSGRPLCAAMGAAQRRTSRTLGWKRIHPNLAVFLEVDLHAEPESPARAGKVVDAPIVHRPEVGLVRNERLLCHREDAVPV